jgi:nitrate/nitrite transport system ATP-binding protein
MSFLELNNVSKSFGGQCILRDVNLALVEGEFVAIVGYSGQGKSTLMSLISGLTRPDTGTILLEGKPIVGPGPDRGLVFQNYSLLPWLTVGENIALAVDSVFPDLSPVERAEKVDDNAFRWLELSLSIPGFSFWMNHCPHSMP